MGETLRRGQRPWLISTARREDRAKLAPREASPALLPYNASMGMQDRDYYREDYAKKYGMSYNPATSRYSRRSGSLSQKLQPTVSKLSTWHPVLVSLATTVICLVVVGILKLISRFT